MRARVELSDRSLAPADRIRDYVVVGRGYRLDAGFVVLIIEAYPGETHELILPASSLTSVEITS